MRYWIFGMLLLSYLTTASGQINNPARPLTEHGMLCPTTVGLAKAWWQRANDFFAGGDIENAVVFFKKSAETDPHFCDARHGLSILYFGLGMLDSAEIFARDALQLNPHSSKLQFNLASVLAAREKHSEALTLLENLEKTDFKKAEVLQLQAQMYLFLEKFELASAKSNASIALCEKTDPYLAALNYLILGCVQLWQQQPDAARPLFEKAQSLGVQVPETYRKAAKMH